MFLCVCLLRMRLKKNTATKAASPALEEGPGRPNHPDGHYITDNRTHKPQASQKHQTLASSHKRRLFFPSWGLLKMLLKDQMNVFGRNRGHLRMIYKRTPTQNEACMHI